MKTKLPITRAYCAELGRAVTITEARREFMSQIAPAVRFHFFCDETTCRDATGAKYVVVTGVNYTRSAEDSIKFKAAHFRHEWAHQPGCGWVLDTDMPEVTVPGSEPGVTRLPRAKLNDLVTNFDPKIRVRRSDNGSLVEQVDQVDNDDAELDERDRRSGLSSTGETRTSDFERLVESFIEARNTLSVDELHCLPLKVGGQQVTTYRKYFQQIKYSDLTGIIYGGTQFIRDYGDGFKLVFYDKRHGLPVFLYVSSSQMNSFRYARYLRTTIDQMRTSGRYATVYALGVLRLSSDGQQWELVVDHLPHLCVVLGRNSNP